MTGYLTERRPTAEDGTPLSPSSLSGPGVDIDAGWTEADGGGYHAMLRVSLVDCHDIRPHPGQAVYVSSTVCATVEEAMAEATSMTDKIVERVFPDHTDIGAN